MKQLSILVTISLLIGIAFSGCGADEKTTDKLLNSIDKAKDEKAKTENKKNLDDWINKKIEIGKKSEASKLLDINSK